MRDAAAIASLLLVKGAIVRDEVPEIKDPDMERQVRLALGAVNFELANTNYSKFIGVRPMAESNPLRDASEGANVFLQTPHYALLYVIWVRLASTKRIHDGESVVKDVRVNTILREFPQITENRTTLDGYLTRLKSLQFIEMEGDIIREGPNLELAINGETMSDAVRSMAGLAEFARRARDMKNLAEAQPGADILILLQGAKSPLKRADIMLQLGVPKQQDKEFSKLLQRLVAQKLIVAEGEKSKRVYHVRKEGK